MMSSPAVNQLLQRSTPLRKKAARLRSWLSSWIGRKAGGKKSRGWGIPSSRYSDGANCSTVMPDHSNQRIARLGEQCVETESIERMPRAAEDVLDFVADQFLNPGTGLSQILPGIKLLGVFKQMLAEGRRQGQAQIGIDVDLGATNAPGNFDVRLGHTRGVLAQFAAVLVDLLHEIFGNARGAVKHQRIITQPG